MNHLDCLDVSIVSVALHCLCVDHKRRKTPVYNAMKRGDIMIGRFTTYFQKLERLSTQELDTSIEKLVRKEKRNTALVVAHIAEMARRKGVLERGYKNLFDYCVRRLQLSEGSVALRIQVANVSRRFPQLLVALAENRVSLTVAGLLAPHLTDDNVGKLLEDCAGMTKRQADEYVVGLRPKPVFEPSIRKTPAPSKKPQTPNSTQPKPAAQPAEGAAPPPTTSSTVFEPARPDRFNFRFSAGREFKERFERLAEVLGVENAQKHMAEILEQALDVALDKKDLKRKRERRLKRKARRATTAEPKPRPDKVTRHVQSEVRERVHVRGGFQCEFRGPDGTRCSSRTGLEVEHARPFARFRSHDERFLRLYCKAHNRLSAERAYGVAFIQNKIAAARRRSRSGGQ